MKGLKRQVVIDIPTKNSNFIISERNICLPEIKSKLQGKRFNKERECREKEWKKKSCKFFAWKHIDLWTVSIQKLMVTILIIISNSGNSEFYTYFIIIFFCAPICSILFIDGLKSNEELNLLSELMNDKTNAISKLDNLK